MRDFEGKPLVPGYNVDKININAGVREAIRAGYYGTENEMVVTYALQRWMRGEEDGAMVTMMARGIDLTSIYRIIAAARAGAEEVSQVDTRARELFEAWLDGHRKSANRAGTVTWNNISKENRAGWHAVARLLGNNESA